MRLRQTKLLAYGENSRRRKSLLTITLCQSIRTRLYNYFFILARQLWRSNTLMAMVTDRVQETMNDKFIAINLRVTVMYVLHQCAFPTDGAAL
ncbi:hypothetical protein ABW22_02840 [Thiobacillus denitrificans]|uniref:Uncharacterized protein n=1 Tax=Thiobacillus denitrificans TaxID=36861 RepID=A0A125BDK6_THIDE|nr:hypothetical protein ABW22_02840 [Thiobacillus denitrificans]